MEINKETLLERSKRIIAKKLNIIMIFICILIVAISSYFLTLYYSPKRSLLMSNIPYLFIFSIIIVILFLSTLLLSKKYPKLFNFFFPVIIGLWFLPLPDISVYVVGIPIIASSILLKPKAAMYIAVVYAIETSLSNLFFFRDQTMTLLGIFFGSILPTSIIIFLYTIISITISKELHLAFALYEKRDNELQAAKEQLAQKVEIQSEEIKIKEKTIEEMQSEQKELSNKMEDMRFTINRLKFSTQKLSSDQH